ncbi:uncharacterized protein [Periplaneta americana]|uniref:uncharacterized protein n=1 Tax=Periplaneta americana TaxID=6978 RepID=UPI0037E8F1D5
MSRIGYTLRADNMKTTIAVICALVILGRQTFGDERAVNIEITETKITCQNNEYITNVELSSGSEDGKTTFTSKCTVVKEIPQDATCATDFYKKGDDGEFKKSAFAVSPSPCCEVMYDNEMYKKLLKGQKFPEKCPFGPGDYAVENYVIDHKNYAKAPLGEFRANFSSYEKDSKKCIYGAVVTVKITEKS